MTGLARPQLLTACRVLLQVGAAAQQPDHWATLQQWLSRQAAAPLLVVFENAEDSINLRV